MGNPADEEEEELKDPERSRTPQKNIENQLNWVYRGPRRLNCQPESMCETDLGLYTDGTDVQFGVRVGLLNQEQRPSDYTAYLWMIFP